MSLFTKVRQPPAGEAAAEPVVPGRPRHRVRARTLTVVAGLFVFVALVFPYGVTSVPLLSLLRLPLEGIVGAAVLVLLPARPRRLLAVLAGVVLGLLTIVRIADLGFYTVLSRPFNPVSDWPLIGDGVDFLSASMGRVPAIVAVVLAALLTVAALVLTGLAVRRLAGIAAAHRRAVLRGSTALAAVWVVLAVTGAQFLTHVPLASRTVLGVGYHASAQAATEYADEQRFTAQSKVDKFHNTPGSQLLTGLRGKDVVLTFVESYGRTSLADKQVDAVLDDGTRQLAAAGYSARSAFLASPVAGAGSWMAHGTLLSGVKVNDQQRYDQLVSGDRMTLTKAFQRADWRTVAVMPDTTKSWPEAGFFGLDKVYPYDQMGYRGPHFSWATMPDEYALSFFQRTEYAKPGRGPLMAEIVLVSSHAPWQPLPTFVPWTSVGDGSVFNAMGGKQGVPKDIWGRDPKTVRAAYLTSIRYTLSTLISYVKTYGDKNLVLMFLGDHQPYSVVTGQTDDHDVPITIVAHDQSVLDRISTWGWQDGLRPDAQAPAWPMDAFRDRFLTTFGSAADPAR